MTILRHNLVQGAALADELMPRIGYQNLFRSGTVNASSADSDYPKENAFDGLTYDAWRSTGAATEWIRTQVASQNADYMAIAAHTLAGCDVKPQRSTDGSVWTDLESSYTVPDDRPIVWEWTSVADAYWRLLIENAPGAVSIGAIHVGLKTTLPRGLPVGFAPPELNERVEYTNVASHGGHSLGRSIVRRGTVAQVQSEPVTFTWAREDWLSFIESARSYAAFFWWSFLGKTEIVYGSVDEESASFSNPVEVTARFRISGINR